MAKINENLADFAFEMLKHVKNDQRKDAFFSPASINLALAVCYGGADGSTKSQMKRRFYGDGVDDADVHAAMREMIDRLDRCSQNDEVRLTVANRLYCQKDFEILQKFRDLAEKHYKSGAFPVDFKREENREKSRQDINDWVSECTNRKITNLIGQTDVNANTKLILVNALYFKGTWANRFDKIITERKKFHATAAESRDIDMMTQCGKKFAYVENDACQALALPYKNGHVKMVLVLPKTKFGLADLEKSLTGVQFISLVNSMESVEVIMEIPKFKVEQSFQLSKTLKALGIEDAFDAEKADFTPITGTRDLHVSEVLHKAFIEVDENGTEAAAATAVIMACGCSLPLTPPPPPKKFIANHPFMFAILTEENNDILFLGHYYYTG